MGAVEQPAIVVLGATGFTGARIARALAARGSNLILAARQKDPLERLAAELKLPRPVRVIHSLDRVDALIEGAAVVVNTIGPYQKYGLPIVAAAIENDAHYVDITGEQAFLRTVLELLDSAARARGLAILCAQGFEYALGYCGCALVRQQLGVPERLEIFYRSGGGMSHGTAQSVIGMFGEKWVTRSAGRLVPFSRRWVPVRVRFPGESRNYSAFPFPGGEPLFVPRSAPGVRDVSDYFVLPQMAAALVTGLGAAGGVRRAALRLPGVKGALQRGVEWAVREPSAAEQATARFTVLVRGTRADRTALCCMRGVDAYGITAQIAAVAAGWLAAGKARQSGVLSTDQAFEARALLDALAPHGLTFELAESASGR